MQTNSLKYNKKTWYISVPFPKSISITSYIQSKFSIKEILSMDGSPTGVCNKKSQNNVCHQKQLELNLVVMGIWLLQ